jgi:hypothetical protein
MSQILPRMAAAVLACTCLGAAKPNLPEAVPDLAATPAAQSVLVDVLANDGALGPGLRLLKAHKPLHGTARIENGRVRYTPNPGFVGSDRFQYMVQPHASQPHLGTVNVEVGGGGVTLQLRGRVADDPIPGATVRVLVGGYTFQAVADANGDYVLDIAALTGDVFVTVLATGTSPTGAPVDFISLVGEIAGLASAAGSDRILTLDENNQVNVTHLSTAQYVLLAEANGGMPPEDDASLRQLTQNIDIDALVELAATIKLVVDGGVPLPAGVDSVLELISEPATLDAFHAALPPGALEASIAEVASGTADLTGFAPGRVPTGYATVFPGDTGTIRVGIIGSSLLTFESATGRGVRLGDAARLESDAGFAWIFEGNDLRLTPDNPVSRTFQAGNANCPDQPVQITDLPIDTRIRRLQDGLGVDVLEFAERFQRTQVDLNTADACPAPAASVEEATARMLGFENATGELPYTVAEALGAQMQAHYRPEQFPSPVASNWGAAVLDFGTTAGAAGSGTVAIPGVNPTFAWSIGAGRLAYALTETADGSTRSYEARRLQTDGRRGEGVFTVATLADGRKTVAYHLSSRVDGSLAFDPALLATRWRSGFDISQFEPTPEDDFGFFLRMDGPGQTGEYESIVYDPATGTTATQLFAPFAWSVEDGQMHARSHNIPFCALGVGSCRLNRHRIWVPLSRDDDRIYVLERLLFRVAGFPDPVLVSERPNFYDITPVP